MYRRLECVGLLTALVVACTLGETARAQLPIQEIVAFKKAPPATREAILQLPKLDVSDEQKAYEELAWLLSEPYSFVQPRSTGKRPPNAALRVYADRGRVFSTRAEQLLFATTIQQVMGRYDRLAADGPKELRPFVKEAQEHYVAGLKLLKAHRLHGNTPDKPIRDLAELTGSIAFQMSGQPDDSIRFDKALEDASDGIKKLFEKSAAREELTRLFYHAWSNHLDELHASWEKQLLPGVAKRAGPKAEKPLLKVALAHELTLPTLVLGNPTDKSLTACTIRVVMENSFGDRTTRLYYVPELKKGDAIQLGLDFRWVDPYRYTAAEIKTKVSIWANEGTDLDRADTFSGGGSDDKKIHERITTEWAARSKLAPALEKLVTKSFESPVSIQKQYATLQAALVEGKKYQGDLIGERKDQVEFAIHTVAKDNLSFTGEYRLVSALPATKGSGSFCYHPEVGVFVWYSSPSPIRGPGIIPTNEAIYLVATAEGKLILIGTNPIMQRYALKPVDPKKGDEKNR